jgi:pimeloyl-ACP methyl ester carboxylesterase
MHYPNLPPLLHRLKRVPTLIVWGREDPIVPLSAGEAYQAAIPGSRLVVLDRCGHHPHIEQPEIVVQHVQEFLNA